ncbi:MAG: QacE family quaternary ammonium compound efflux SMR transporter [Zoogloeaceae bacterium]|jgi:small multidrug resistance pump|nr:QacE family quaternary ammonium compound efflux SMR transporter [Zoogloeaceae bacterium]
MHDVYLALAIMAEVVATSTLKGTAGFTRLWPSVIVVVGYAASFYCLSRVLERLPVGVIYAIWSGAGIVLVSLVAWWIYGQKLDFPAVLGISFIVVGVAIINLFSKTLQH